MRLGEFRTKTRDCKNKLNINLSVYDDIKHNADGYIELDIDMVTDNDIYLRPIDDIKHHSAYFTFKCNGNNCSVFENDVWLTIEEIVDTLNNQRNAILRYEYELYKLKKDNKKLKNKKMLNKKFRVRFEQEDGKGEIVNEKGVELTAREVVNYLNEMTTKCSQLEQKIKEKNKYQRVLEDKIRRLKDRIKVLEK